MGVLMGVYHKGHCAGSNAYREKMDRASLCSLVEDSHSPPTWLLNGKNENLTTIPLRYLREEMLTRVKGSLTPLQHTAKIGGSGAF